MKDFMIVIAILLALMGLSYAGLVWNGILATKGEAIRTQVVEQSKAYRDGMRKELNRVAIEYAKADSVGKDAIRSYVVTAYAAEPVDEYPANLQTFLHDMGL